MFGEEQCLIAKVFPGYQIVLVNNQYHWLDLNCCRDAWDFALDACLCQLPAVLEGSPYIYSAFFTEQLTAFQVWLTYGNEERTPPEQLPIVLQVRPSSAHNFKVLTCDKSCQAQYL